MRESTAIVIKTIIEQLQIDWDTTNVEDSYRVNISFLWNCILSIYFIYEIVFSYHNCCIFITDFEHTITD